MSFDLRIVGRDVAIGNNGDLAVVDNTDKLIQDILKILTTKLGANPFYPWYGSPISRTLIGKAYDDTFVSNVASGQLKTALEMLQRLQREQLKKDQLVTPQEQIAAIQNINIQRNPTDPRFYSIDVTVLTKAFKSTVVSLRVSSF